MRKQQNRTKTPISLEIDPELKERMIRRRDRTGQSLTYQLDHAIRAWLESQAAAENLGGATQ